MNLFFLMTIALQSVAGMALPETRLQVALQNYRAITAGQRLLGDLTARERADVADLDRWLRSEKSGGPSETRQQCVDRLSTGRPTALEQALLDLKCSQRAGG